MISVIICTHNPIIYNLRRVLLGLQKQTLTTNQWELVIIDNGSNIPIEKRIDLSWHPNAKIVCEENLGLVRARLKGISETTGSLLVFVDDDNILHADYLELAREIAIERPYLGAFGGTAIGEFETDPDRKVLPYLEMIAIRQIDKIAIGNFYEWKNTPAGAGLVIKREVADYYANKLKVDKIRIELDRKGDSLMSSGDIDLSYTSIDIGYLNGLFPQLVLTHIIPTNRVSVNYLVKLQKYNILSNNVLEYYRFKKWPVGKNLKAYLLKQFNNLWNRNMLEFNLEKSRRAGFLASIQKSIEIREIVKKINQP